MASSTIILNSTNRDPTTNNRFTYNFPSNVKFNEGDTVAVENISLYNSIFNIEAERANNTFSIIWNADSAVTYDFVIPDSFMDIPAINYYIQYVCVQNGLYCINASGNYVYFVELVINSTVYGSELRTYILPDTTEAGVLGYTKPAGASWSFHASADATPQLIIDTDAFGSLFGMEAGTFPATPQTTSQYIASTVTPQISPVNSLILTCNLIQSELSNPSNIFYSMPLNSAYGSLMSTANTTKSDLPIFEGSYKNIVIEVLDQLYNRVKLNDFEVLIKLRLIRHKKPKLLK